MEIKKVTTLSIKLKSSDIESFKSVVSKCVTTDEQLGFKAKMFTPEEIKLLKSLNGKL